MKSAEIRKAFLDFFESKGHKVVASSSLVPGNDPTLLFTNAGMVPFKDVFLGTDKRSYRRATSSQKCVRAGGKHNDLENVGYTARHHTFFEMLGNFSFGDYFKVDAIKFAWEFLTKVLGLPEEKLWVTVHVSDDEAADIWLKEVGVSAERFSRLDEDNFWQMGDTGPCGPSSEVFYDHGEDVPGGPPGSEGDELDRYIEIWNLVFMQYERQTDGSLSPLPKPSVDTGMGLERIAAVMQGVHSNYDIDLFQNLLSAAADVTQVKDKNNNSLKVIADHIRSCAFLITDGVLPDKEGRGFVLRRIIRRAIRHGNKLGQRDLFFSKLVPALCAEMGEAYPELIRQQQTIEKALQSEEEQFAKTLEKGLAMLNQRLEDLDSTVIPGDIVFSLHDTYGFPVDLTNDIAREKNLTLDIAGYEALMEAQRQRGRASGTFDLDYTIAADIEGDTVFEGYTQVSREAQVTGIIVEGQRVDALQPGQKAAIILDATPFYAEAGGQVGDSGVLQSGEVRFEIVDCQKANRHYLHIGQLLSGEIKTGMRVSAEVDGSIRQATAMNHSATHLLHAALRSVLGEHVTQKGSLVDAEKLRFDFSHFEALKPEEIKLIEEKVNGIIRENSSVNTEVCDLEEAKNKGAMALFGEKYDEQVRVLSMGDGFSVELCGGIHVSRTGEIGFMKIVSESGTAAGVRRIEAVTGAAALARVSEQENTLNQVAGLLKTTPNKIIDKLEQLFQQNKLLEKDIAQFKSKLASASIDEWVAEAVEINGIKFLVKSIEADTKSLRDMVDKLKNKLGDSAVLLASISNGKISLVAGVSKAVTGKISAGEIVKVLAAKIDGKGGGRPDMAQGGGTNVAALPAAMREIEAWIHSKLTEA